MDNLARAADYLNRCSKCGGCQAVCPLYQETRAEPYVARGKLFLLKNHLEGKLPLSAKMKEIMSLCLLCKACVNQCPNNIPVDQLVLGARQKIAQEKGISFVKKNVFQHLLKNNGRLTLAARLGWLYQRAGVQWLVRKSNILKVFGEEIVQKERLLPKMAKRPFRKQVPRFLTCSRPKLRVAYYTGCLTNFVYPATGHAVVNVLRRHDLEILIPEQWCCGIPALASGDEKTAAELARKNVEVFQRAGVDAVITDCASCGSMLKEYADLLGTPEAKAFAGKVLDFSQFLSEAVSFRAGEIEVPRLATYHDPCHLKRGQGVFEAPRRLIRKVPGLRFKEMKEPDRCCGAAGSFNLTYYNLAAKIGRRKVQNIRETGADFLVTGCPSCIMQLRHMLELENSPVQVLHLAELLSMTYSSQGQANESGRGCSHAVS
ncbi:MAG: (Fe-S)-binding protein [Firmicutes bacterium]|nr:(Fe-S)-binding protein [Bacillota bacterium]